MNNPRIKLEYPLNAKDTSQVIEINDDKFCMVGFT